MPTPGADPANLLAAFGGSSAEDTALLDAARAEFVAHGFRRTSIGDIAQRAGVSRPTLYRRIGDKNDIVRQVVLREVATFFLDTAQRFVSLDSEAERLVEAFAAGVVELHSNELARAILEYEPETIAGLLGGDHEPGVLVVRATLAVGLSGGDQPTRGQEQAAELILRVTASLIVEPSDLFPLRTEEQARWFARAYLVPLAEAGRRVDDAPR